MMRHAGIGFPNGPASLVSVFDLPSPNLLMLVTEARFHHDEAIRAGKSVLWRAIPNRGKRPAEVGWSPARAVDEALNLTDTAREPIRDFMPWNELDLRDERGDGQDDYSDLERRYNLLGGFLFSALTLLRQRLPGTRLHFPAFTPDHDALLYVDRWRAVAELADVVDFHAYDSLDKIRAQYEAYRAAFPTQPLALTEWHCKGDLNEERRVLTWLADTMAADPLLDAAYFFIWRWWDHPGWWSDDWDIEHNPDRYALFRSPPVAVQPAPEPAPPEPIQEPAMPTSDPWEHFSAEQIAAASGCPLDAVTEHWPKIVRQLALCGIADRPVQVAAIGTVAIETASTFRPIHEYGTEADWADYEGGPEYAGRGFIQLTHRSNYRTFGEYVDDLWHAGGAIDLVARPDDALDPNVAAAVLATYFVHHTTLQGYSIPDAARAGDWEWVRRLVQGGTAGSRPPGTDRICAGRSPHADEGRLRRQRACARPGRVLRLLAGSPRMGTLRRGSAPVGRLAGEHHDRRGRHEQGARPARRHRQRAGRLRDAPVRRVRVLRQQRAERDLRRRGERDRPLPVAHRRTRVGALERVPWVRQGPRRPPARQPGRRVDGRPPDDDSRTMGRTRAVQHGPRAPSGPGAGCGAGTPRSRAGACSAPCA
jgi:predicted chitinase